MDELSGFVSDVDPDIILLCKTWCNDNVTNAFLNLPGFDLITDLRKDRTDTQLGKEAVFLYMPSLRYVFYLVTRIMILTNTADLR